MSSGVYPPQAVADGNLRGILAMTVCQVFFLANDTFTKLAVAHIPATEIMALRGVVASLIVLGLAWRLGVLPRWGTLRNPIVFARAAVEALVATIFLTALAFVTLGDITVVLQATPLILVALSAVFLKEHVGWRRWLAVVAGFAGVLLIVRPASAAFNAYTLLALVAAFLIAFRDLLTKRIAGTIPSIVVTLATTLTVCVVGFAGAAFQDWKPIDATLAFYLTASAAFVASGNYLVIRALREAEVSVVSPYRYSAVLWAMLLGFLVWGDVPDWLAVMGAGLVVGAGLYSFHREAVLARARRRKSS